jgi:hypothetical protein
MIAPIHVAHADRTVHYYDITFGFNNDSLPLEHFVTLFNQIITMSNSRDALRYFRSGDKRLFIQGITFVPSLKQIHGKLRAVRLDIAPEVLNMSTDTARDIEMAEEEGIVETTHFVLDYRRNRRRLAVEYNAAGAKAHEFGGYLQHVGGRAGLQSVLLTPVMTQESLTEFQRRIGLLADIEISVPKDSINNIQRYNPGLASSIQAAKDFFGCDTVIMQPKFDFRNVVETGAAKQLIDSIISAWRRNPLRRKDFETFKVRGQDTDSRGTLQVFDLLRDDVKDRIKVQKRHKSRVLDSIDMFEKMVAAMTQRRLV